MSADFERINNEFKKNRRDLEFPHEDLDNLTLEERAIIEEQITNSIKMGDDTSYKYIPYLKIFNPEDNLKSKNITSLPLYDQAEIYYNLYLKSKRSLYIDKIISLAREDAEVYSMLTYLYITDKIPNNLKEDTFCEIIKLSKNNETYFKIYETRKKRLIENIPKENPVNGILGFAVGDALGVPAEFTPRKIRKLHFITEMIGNGTYRVPAGTWSDDTSMTLATIDSIINKEMIDYDDIMQKFCSWFTKSTYTATDNVFDIGISTKKSLIDYIYGTKALECGSSDIKDNGNGSLMRMTPIAYYLSVNNFSDEEETEIINNISSLTHAHEISKLGCKIYVDFLKQLIKYRSKEEAYEYIKSKDYGKSYSKKTVDSYSRILKDNLKALSEENISSSGYIISTLEAVLWCTLNSNSYEQAVEMGVNLGEDTDTIGAITGSLNGVIYGINNIPERWKNVLIRKNYIEDKCLEFSIALSNIKNKNKKEALKKAYYDRMTSDAFHLDNMLNDKSDNTNQETNKTI